MFIHKTPALNSYFSMYMQIIIIFYSLLIKQIIDNVLYCDYLNYILMVGYGGRGRQTKSLSYNSVFKRSTFSLLKRGVATLIDSWFNKSKYVII